LFQIDLSVVPGGFFPSFVALDSSKNVYVTDANGGDVDDTVVEFSEFGTYLTQWGTYGTNNGQFENPQGVAVDSSNDVYVADYHNSRIEKFSSSGTYLAQWGSYGSGNSQFDGPVGIAVDSSNNCATKLIMRPILRKIG
jgi:DNA-binding beta-propeller fold protein YncE